MPITIGRTAWTDDDGCFSGDTKVRLSDGTTPTLRDLATTGKSCALYTIRNGQIVAGLGTNPRLTIHDAQTVIVLLWSGEEACCTPGHRWMLADGSYREARALRADDALMSYDMPVSVQSVRPGPVTDVFDITVADTENFALAIGAFVHNSGTTGTVINNAVKTSLYDQIDAALAALGLGINTIATVGTITTGVWNAGAVTSSGLISSTGFGTHSFSAGGTGANELQVRNTTAGTGNYSSMRFGNDVGSATLFIQALSSTFTTSNNRVASGANIEVTEAGGLSIVATHASGALRFYSGGTTLRGQFYSSGGFSLGAAADPGGPGKIALKGAFSNLIDLTPNADVTGGLYLTMRNAAGTTIGSITELAGNASVAYNTTSDKRLKADLGLATDLLTLRSVRVHDFTWITGGDADRGVFAQEAHPVFPRAITVGSDETKDGHLVKPWMVDYSKFVPDLIVGWQQHEARIAALEERMH